jgi:UDP-glucose 4-epimerase
MKSESVLILGGSGFLGSHVADALSDDGYFVKIFDTVPSKYLRSGQEMIVGNILDLVAVTRAAEGCSYIYNFAGLADIDSAKDRPIETLQLNVLGNAHALEAARTVGAKRFVFASTVYVYSEAGSFYRAS